MLRYILLVIVLSAQLVSAQTFRIEHDRNNLAIVKTDSYDRIKYNGITDLSALEPAIGAPQLPVYLYRVRLQPGETVTDLHIDRVVREEIDGLFSVYPRQPLWNQYADNRFVAPDEKAYASEELTPAAPVRFLGTGRFNGITIAHFAVSPVQYIPSAGKLYFVKSVQFSIQTDNDQQPGVAPYLSYDAIRASDFVDRMTENISHPLGKSASVHDLSPEDLTSGLIDRYVIITTENLKDAFKPLVDWKIRRGVPTVVRTLEWIRQNFPEGTDDAERMRNFIRWSYQKRGTKYVMFGGDTDIIPTRIIHTGGYTFPVDYYFADLDGTWNANNNDIFGEAEDNVDAYPEVYVSRIPVGNVEDVQRFITKLFKYEKLTELNPEEKYPANVLYMASNLSNINDGRDLIMKNIDPVINPDFERRMITESGEIGNSAEVPKAELNKNYGLIFSESHGAYFTIRPGGTNSNIFSYELDDLTNSMPPVWFIASCNTNDIIKRSFSEMYILSKHGGGVAYIGNTDYEYPFSGIYLERDFFDLVFNQGYPNIAEALFLSRYRYLGFLNGEGATRIIVFATLELGDAEMPIWTENPARMQVEQQIVSMNDAPALQITVTDSAGSPLEGAVATLYRENQVYKIGYSDPAGTVLFSLDDVHTDSAMVTVSKHNYIPYERPAALAHDTYQLSVTSWQRNEIYGNGNKQCEPGESFDLTFSIRNDGVIPIEEGLVLQLVAETPGVDFASPQKELREEILPGMTVSSPEFSFTISPDFPADTTALVNVYYLMNDQVVDHGEITFPIRLPMLTLNGQSVETEQTGSENVSYLNARFMNRGKGMATGAYFTIRPADSLCRTEQDSFYIGNLAGGAVSDDFGPCIIRHTQPLDSVRLLLTIGDAYGHIRQQVIDFLPPDLPKKLTTKPAENESIQLSWKPSEDKDLLGYNIYRRQAGDDAFTRINSTPLPMAGYYVDSDVQGGLTYEYFVTAVDSSFNISPTTSDTVAAWSAVPYQTNFPLRVNPVATGSEMNGVITYDLDGDGRCEIIYSGGHGLIDIYHSDGSLMSQIGNLGGFITVPALGNVYGDEEKEVVVTSYLEAGDQNSLSIVDPIRGQLIHQIPLEYKAPSSVVLKDLDKDGLDDIILLTHAGNAPTAPKQSRLFIWRSTGTAWDSLPGWPEDGYVFANSDKYSLGQPAVADLDHSGDISIVVGTQLSKVFCFKPVQSPDPVWVKKFSGDLYGMINGPISLADLDRDGNLDIIFPIVKVDRLFVLNYQGDPLPGWEQGQPVEVPDPYGHASPAVVGNLDDDPELEIVYVGRKHVYVFNHDGTLQTGWPVGVENGDSNYDSYINKLSTYSSPVLADLNQDGVTDIIFVTTFGIIHALDGHTGKDIIGFPIDTNNDLVQGQSPMVDDIDRDGDLELLYIAHEGRLFVWDLPQTYGQTTTLQWNQPYGNIQHTGELDTMAVEVVSGIAENETPDVPRDFYLKQNYPNPFNPSTTIAFGLKTAAHVELDVYNILGQKVASLASGKMDAGVHELQWNGKNGHGMTLPSGIYFYQLRISDVRTNRLLFQQQEKMVLIK